MKISNNFISRNSISFTSYKRVNPKTNLSVSTSFYHDYPALQKAVDIIEKDFPNGTDILIYAGSNGEEAISVDSMLNHPERYHISSIDPFKEAIDFAKRSCFGIHKLDDDSFIIDTIQKDTTPEQLRLKARFYNSFEEIQKPEKALNNVNSGSLYDISFPGLEMQKYFKLKPEVKNRIQFIQGDIRNINSFPVKSQNGKAGAVFFRNAIYHLTQNDLTGVFKYGDKPNININKYAVIKNLIDNVYNKLDIGGIFVMGHHTQEHFFIADKYTPPEQSVLIDKQRGIRLTTAPLPIKALLENGKFEPVFEEAITDLSGLKKINLPTIWKKIK